jgi:hypothetical protein
MHTQGSTGKDVFFDTHRALEIFRSSTTWQSVADKLQNEPAEMTAPLFTRKPQMSGQSVQAPSLTTSSLDDMFKVETVVQQIMTQLNGTVSDEEK